MSERNDQPVADRRRFLRDSLALGAGAAAATTVAGAVDLPAPADTVTTPERQRGYHLTEHVADYYKTAAL